MSSESRLRALESVLLSTVTQTEVAAVRARAAALLGLVAVLEDIDVLPTTPLWPD